MIVQAGHNVLAYNTVTKPSNPQQPWNPGIANAIGTVKNSDSVEISQAGKNMLATSATSTDQSTQSWLSQDAHSNPELAKQMAYDLAYAPEEPLLNITDFVNGTGPMRYTSTNMPVTEESQEYFNNMSAEVMQKKTAIYETGMQKGTAPADILDQMVAYMDSLPKEYQEMTNWGERAYG